MQLECAKSSIDVVVIAICAVICGADSWVDVEMFGESKKSWLSQLLVLPHGMPSHDTFGRVFSRLDPIQVREMFQRVGEDGQCGDGWVR